MNDYLTLKTTNCKNCYKCIRHCPVKSIRFDNNQAHIITEDCVLCGNCFVICPQNAKEIRSDIGAAEALLGGGKEVYASVAPSFAANYGLPFASLEKALKKLGFTGAEETAIGATIVKRRYDELVNSNSQQLIISSCCHSVNRLIQKYYPDVLPFMAQVLSPMQAHCMDIKRRRPEARTVFIGPCISKKAEAETYTGFADCVLTFEELSAWLEARGILLEPQPEEKSNNTRARLFPLSGGILRAMQKANKDYTYLCVDGMENCIRAVEDVAKGKLGKCFIEMSACPGSCVGGPAMNRGGGKDKPASGCLTDDRRYRPVRDFIAISRSAGGGDFPAQSYGAEELIKPMPPLTPGKVHLGESAILEVLRKIGKTRPEHELNCGTCGYNTCRGKAIAVLEGKANLFMCLPFLVEKARSFSDDIIKNTPNGIIVLNEDMQVQEINTAACRLLNITASHILGDQVVRILDPGPFLDAVEQKKNTYNKLTYLADYEKYVDQTVIFDANYHIIICIMRDVTEQTRRKKTKEEFDRKTVELTDKIIEKQMRAVQEIASLLGESTAETKIALTKLKESLNDE